MPTNEITINGITYEVPDSFMPPLDAYLQMVEEKCTPSDHPEVDRRFDRSELQVLRERAFAMSEGVGNTCWQKALCELGDALDRVDAMIARTEVHKAGEVSENGEGSV